MKLWNIVLVFSQEDVTLPPSAKPSVVIWAITTLPLLRALIHALSFCSPCFSSQFCPECCPPVEQLILNALNAKCRSYSVWMKAKSIFWRISCEACLFSVFWKVSEPMPIWGHIYENSHHINTLIEFKGCFCSLLLMIHPQAGSSKMGTITSVFVQPWECISYVLYITKNFKSLWANTDL